MQTKPKKTIHFQVKKYVIFKVMVQNSLSIMQNSSAQNCFSLQSHQEPQVIKFVLGLKVKKLRRHSEAKQQQPSLAHTLVNISARINQAPPVQDAGSRRLKSALSIIYQEARPPRQWKFVGCQQQITWAFLSCPNR
jgi:hypothetical protein